MTAFLYNGMAARPYWNASILAPRFIASAFCSGPAVMIILFQMLRRTTRLQIKDEAIFKIAELMAYAMFVNLFLLGAEVFKEYYSATEHLLYTQYLWSGIGAHRALVPFAWSRSCAASSPSCSSSSRGRADYLTLNLGCLLIWAGVYIEKGMGLVIPGMTPDTLGEILRVHAHRDRVGHRRRRLRRRVPRLHAAREGGSAHHDRNFPGAGALGRA